MTDNEIQEILLEEFHKQKVISNLRDWRCVTENLIESLKRINLSQLYIDHPVKYKLEKLENDTLESSSLFGGICELNDNIKEKIVSDIYMVEIKSFYPTVIKQLIESNILDTDENFNKVFLTIYNFKQTHSRTKLNDTISNVTSIYSDHFHTFYKTWMNYLFGIISHSRQTESYRYNNTINVTMYTRNIFEKIIREFTWVYVDTDSIFCYIKDKNLIKEIFDKYELHGSISPIGYAYFKSKKKYLYTDGKGSITYKGIKFGTEVEAENELKILYRNDEIDKILN